MKEDAVFITKPISFDGQENFIVLGEAGRGMGFYACSVKFLQNIDAENVLITDPESEYKK